MTKEISIPVRLIVHLLLTIFLATAANKFFTEDLDFEKANGFYARIFEGKGDAPDQYRILSLLPLKALCEWMPFNHAVLIYNAIFGFLTLELFWLLGGSLKGKTRLGLSFGFAILYIYTQYTGWRPDTLGLLLPCLLAALVIHGVDGNPAQWGLFGLLVVVLGFCRADIALVYSLFAAFYRKSYWWAVWAIVPIVIQFALQKWIYPEAIYYSKTIMLEDNVRLHYLVNNPATYLILATLVAFAGPIQTFLKATFRKYFYFYLLLGGYVLLVLVVGRVNEYRLYLPFLPLLLLIVNGRYLQIRG